MIFLYKLLIWHINLQKKEIFVVLLNKQLERTGGMDCSM
ncbi:hypothetical protein EUBDOL_01598 [Amedibacillus dolichus DSM 3991]|uniref:Uncharacterized protein n=1 Tax=Amedibacillus dolichus DSM 3991 TaxID=428127 RepID=A8RD58_9FIRM|nr:hypothetical protein EUBDOL_01598 [Amedibacillus dolichus DSM 3991]